MRGKNMTTGIGLTAQQKVKKNGICILILFFNSSSTGRKNAGREWET
jgi:hypothetical protein